MKQILKTIKGLEPIVIQETKSYKPKKILDETIKINSEKIQKPKSATKVYQFIKKFNFKNKTEIINQDLKIKKYLKNSFVVRCKRTGKHDFNSIEIEQKLGEKIHKKYNIKVNLENPETLIYVEIINNVCLIGLNPINLEKRNYKVRTTSQTLNSCIAYSLLKLANYKPSETLLDPFCKSGDILIEAALSTNKKTNLIGLDKNTKPIEINSKIAKVNIEIRRAEIDWLDTLFKKNSIDKIITSPPKINKINKKDVLPEYRELFNQADYILKNNGSLTIITTKPQYFENYAKEYKFKMIKKHTIQQKTLIYHVLIFKKWNQNNITGQTKKQKK